MSINSICLDLPIKLDDIFNFSFNFDGLKKVIDFFQKNNSILVSLIKDFNKRMLTFESLKSDIDAIKIKSINIEKSNEDINNSFSNIKEKIMKLETKYNEISQKIEENSEIIIKEKYMLDSHEENINKLNIYAKENYSSIQELKENYDAIKKKADTNSLKINELDNKNKEAMDLIKSNSGIINKEKISSNEQIEIINANINNINNTISNMKKISDIKNKEYDKNINDIWKNISNNYKPKKSNKSLEYAFMENVNNINTRNMPNYNITDNTNNNTINNNINNNTNNKINNPNDEEDKAYKFDNEKENIFNKLYQELKLNEKKLIEENLANNRLIKEIQSNIDNLKIKLKNISKYKNDNDNNNNNDNYNNSIIQTKISNSILNNDFDYITTDKYKILSDNLKLLSVAINSKPNKDDFESLKRNLEHRIKKIEIIQNSSFENKINLSELKEQKENTSLLNTKTIELIIEKIQLSLNDNISPLIKEAFLKYGKNIDLSNNLVILEIIKNNKKYLEEIDTKFKTKIENKNKIIKDIDERVDSINDQVLKLNENNNINNVKINSLLKAIEGPEDESDEEDEKKKNIDEKKKNIDKMNKGAIKERLLRLSDFYYEVRDRIVLLEKKQAAFSKEVKEEIKNNLKNETTRIVEQFKNKLSNFTYKFEDALKKKIDQIGLYTFEKRINSKLLFELKEKLDKNELKKSNSIMNKKIDSLENKISKTLVDTIIDLQMDEAPLIVKQNNHMEVCASCNQLLRRNNSISCESTLSQNKTQSKKFKIKNAKFSENNMESLKIKSGLSSPRKYLPEIHNTNNSKDK